ncbi:hypothetical protein GCM10020370_18300 [Paenibacillus hodogayensis]
MNRNNISYNCCEMEFVVIRLNVKKGSKKNDKNSLMVVLAMFSELIIMLDFGLLLVAILTFTIVNNIISINNEANNM